MNICQSLKSHTGGKVQWQALDEWKNAWDSCRGVFDELKVEGEEVVTDILNQENDLLDEIKERSQEEKANWLAIHQVGRNYDIAKYDHILPIAISPFVEFIPSQDTRYWVTKDIPRVLMPGELEQLLNNIHAATNAFNKVSLH